MNRHPDIHDAAALAATPEASERIWTLVGTTASGKSFLLYSALFRRELSKSVALIPDAEARSLLVERLREHIAHGVPAATSSGLVRYRVMLQSQGTAAVPPADQVVLVDGPGGEILPELVQAGGQKPDVAQDYASTVEQSEALLLVLPHPTQGPGHSMAWVNTVRDFVDGLTIRPPPGLRRIALCIPKVDHAEMFPKVCGSTPDAAAMRTFTHAVYRTSDPNCAVVHALRGLKTRLQDGIEIAVFPVSSFGTIGQTGRRNLIPHANIPVVHPIGLRGIDGRKGIPLAPRDFDDGEINRYWRPFNVHAPFEFLYSGQFDPTGGVALDDMPQD